MRPLNSYTIKITMLLLIGIMSMVRVQAFNFTNDAGHIVLDKETKTLTAPVAEAYEWFLNGEKLTEKGNQIAVTTSGEYSVLLTYPNGEVTKENINLLVTVDEDIIVIYTIGDSTVQDYTTGYYPRTGWGQVLQYFFNADSVMVDNRAVGGTSSKSFYNYYWKTDGEYGQIVEEIEEGDIVLIQFGINDAAPDTARHTEPFGSFQDYLTLYVEESRAKGAIPVIVATLRRNAWNDDGTVYPAYQGYPVAARELAGELNVPLIDLDARTGQLMNSLGRDYVGPYWYMNLEPGEYPNYTSGSSDDVHFQHAGAVEMARLVVEELQNDTVAAAIDSLTQHVADMHQVTVLQNEAEGGIVTRTAAYPEGLEVTLKAKPAVGYVFVEWQNESGASASTDPIHLFTMGSSDTTFTAVFEYLGLGETELWIEAECGDVGSLWNIVEDSLASNGKYVTIQPGNTSGSSVPSASGRITYTFDVTGGIYYLFARVLLPTVEDDSFWMKIDDGSWVKVTWDVAITDWEWREIRSIEFTEGEHVITIAYREDGALLDKIHIGSTIPAGIGEPYNCCCEVTGTNEYYEEVGFSQHVWIDGAQAINIKYDMKTSAKVDFVIHNSVGQLVYQDSLGKLNAGVHTHSLRLDLTPGVYILTTQVEEGFITQKFIVH